MLMALLIMTLLGGGSAEIFARDDFRAVERVVEDESRVAAAVEIMTRVNNRMGGALDQRRQAVTRIASLDGDSYAPADAYGAVFEELWQQREDATNGYIRDVFELRGQITREEWAGIFDGGVAEGGR